MIDKGKIGGAKRDRTADLNTASVALSQLSYSPVVAPNLILNGLFSKEYFIDLRVSIIIRALYLKQCFEHNYE